MVVPNNETTCHSCYQIMFISIVEVHPVSYIEAIMDTLDMSS